MFILRDAQKGDLAQIKELAALLNTVNLPDDERLLAQKIDASRRSFGGRIREPLSREYLFVLEEPQSGRIAGTSMIIAQHGTREAPHIYLDVFTKEHYSATLDRHFKHPVLQIGYNYEGPTEIGGLVVHPDYRGRDKPGKQLSFVRFLFIAMHRDRFRDRVLAELLPPLLPDGRSLLWEALGRKLTGLSYAEADRYSRQNKEFIQQLFPQGEIYASLFAEKVQKVIGRVGAETEGVKAMLEKAGFRYDEHIDPFDGGPHFSAATADVRPIREYRRARVAAQDLEVPWEERLVGLERAGRQRFLAVKCACRLEDDTAVLPRAAKDALDVKAGDRVHTIPFGDGSP
jgi:arginine N-succinyltransferase